MKKLIGVLAVVLLTGCGVGPVSPGGPNVPHYRVFFEVSGFPATVTYSLPGGGSSVTVTSSDLSIGPLVFSKDDPVTLCSSGSSVTKTKIKAFSSAEVMDESCLTLNLVW